MIENFPGEIILEIACLLGQNDSLSLSYTCLQLNEIITPRLYYALKFDSSKKIYNSLSNNTSIVHIPSKGYQGRCIAPTKVSTLYSLNRLFKVLYEHPKLARNIKVISFCEEIPDISDLQLIQYLTHVLPWCDSLRAFNWYSSSFELPLNLLGPVENMIQLNGNFNYTGLSPRNLSTLTTLNLSKVLGAKCLESFSFSSCPNLQELIISKSRTISNDFRLHKAEPTFVTYSPFNTMNESDSLLTCLFKKHISNKLQLTKLSLKGITVSEAEAEMIKESVDLECLKELSILNCTEATSSSAPRYGRIRTIGILQSFLEVLSSQLINLEELNVYIANALNYNNRLFRVLSGLKLKSLNVTVNINAFESLDDKLQQLFSSINGERLEFLNVDYHIAQPATVSPSSNKFTNHYSVDSIKNIASFANLQYLQIPISSYRISSMFSLVKSLKHLNTLHLNMKKFEDDPVCSPKSPHTCLIHPEYFDYYNTVGTTRNSEHASKSKYENYASDFQALNAGLQYTIFETGQDQFVFSS